MSRFIYMCVCFYVLNNCKGLRYTRVHNFPILYIFAERKNNVRAKYFILDASRKLQPFAQLINRNQPK